MLRLYWEFSRPFTLVPPMVGILSGSLIGYAATRAPFRILPVSLAIVAAAVLNAASNGLNQIYDLPNDRVNKPHRPLASKRMTLRQAWWFVWVSYAVALIMTAEVNAQTFFIYLIAALATVAYSAPPLRLKRRPWVSNLTIALTRGELLKVAGWASVATVLDSWEPWYIGLIYFLFLMGATTTKDFADLEGDRIAGCVTLPLKYGIEKRAHDRSGVSCAVARHGARGVAEGVEWECARHPGAQCGDAVLGRLRQYPSEPQSAQPRARGRKPSQLAAHVLDDDGRPSRAGRSVLVGPGSLSR